ncbi:MAG: ATP-dependent DNA helicase RecQ [Rubricoccaceae bacterium]
MPAPSDDPALGALRRYWGYDAFRPGQREAIAALMAGRDVLAILPTGGGKSLLYQVPPVATRGLALVVSPLIALMRDQVDALARRGIPAALASAELSAREQDQLWTDAEFGKYRLVYVTPERLATDLFRARVPRLALSLLAVDEAHCISEWGHDFRPAYRRIAEIRPLLRGPGGRRVPVAAVTGSATPEVQRDIAAQLHLENPHRTEQGFDRPNLHWSVRRGEDKRGALREIATRLGGTLIVYAGTRRGTETWAAALRADGLSAEAYHAGLDGAMRTAVQRRWLAGETRIVVATSAFGMGIDKPDVRGVVHVALPPTLEAYVQEAGRAGRDGAPAHAVLLVGPDDDALPRRMADDGHPDAAAVRRVYDAASSMAGLAVGSAPGPPATLDLAVLARVSRLSERGVRAAAERIEQAGLWVVEPLEAGQARVALRGTPAALRAALAGQPAVRRFADALARALPPEAFRGEATVCLDALAARVGLAPARLVAGLGWLAERGLARMETPETGLRLRWTAPRAARAPLDAAALGAARRRAFERLGRVVAYVEAEGCRRHFLLAYFGQEAPRRCEHCDNCTRRGASALVTGRDEALLRRLLGHVARGEPRETWLPEVPPARRDALVRWLVQEGHLVQTGALGGALAVAPEAAVHFLGRGEA